jgi:hypothetical protein
MLIGSESGPVVRTQLLVWVSAGGRSSKLTVGPAALVVTPADEPFAVTDVEGVPNT